MTTLDANPSEAAVSDTTSTTISDTAPDTTEDFAARVVESLDKASTAILLSIGHQTGLFDTMRGLPPATSVEIADAAGLNERYVREWLGGLVAARVIDYAPQQRAYHLPEHRAAVLTRAAGPDNLARVAQFIPLLAEVEQKIVDRFHTGGGLSYSEYPRFHRLMAEQSGEVFDAALIDVILPMADGLVGRLREGADLADIGCGSGHAVNVIAQAFPASRVTGLDFSEEGLATGRDEATRLNLSNATFVARDVAELDETEAYDAITAFDAIHDQAHPARVLANIYRALRPGGIFLMVDIKASTHVENNIGVPFAPYLYTVSTLHCMTVSLALDGDGLGTVWGRELATEMLTDAGFDDIVVREIDTDPINYYYVARKR
ncbi:class I SAM-dependent methyltransferase [Mycolicibacterium goodii]|uniref:Methyltransferase n=1 Tax=Mycolicibacterium goodii TaxID=134601 RepID=A0A0K0X7Y3_MYCGD|nr:methyltransferase [Mycolicibacterium goodii]